MVEQLVMRFDAAVVFVFALASDGQANLEVKLEIDGCARKTASLCTCHETAT